MEHELERFLEFIRKEKNMSVNTELSYMRDLKKLCNFQKEHGITDFGQLTDTNLTSFVLDLETKGFSNATISRTIASIKSFAAFLVRERILDEDVSAALKAPRVEKKQHDTLSSEDMFLLLEQPDENTKKGIRDKAMLELLYSTGIRVTQLVELKVDDVNLKLGYITCDKQSFQIGREAQKALAKYMTEARDSFVKTDSNLLFFNCSGSNMSRQGFWKMLKVYAKSAGIKSVITPHSIRSSLK